MSEPGDLTRIGHKIALGAGWMVATRIVVRLLGVISTIILARILTPADFGLVALATGVSAAIAAFTEFNLRVWLIRMPMPERSHYDTLWSMSVLRGAFIAFIVIATAFAIGNWFDDLRLHTVLIVLGLCTLLEGGRNVGVIDFERNLAFNRHFVLFVVPRLVSFVVTIALGMWWRNYWALVVGLATRSVVDFILTYTIHPMRPRPSLRHWRDAFGFSKWLLVSNLLAFGYLRMDVFILGKLLGAQTLGLYSVAREIADLASREVVAPIRRVMLPGLSRLTHDRALLTQAFFNGYSLIVLIALPLCVGIALLAAPIVKLLLGEQWLGSITLIQILSIYALSAVVMANQGPLFLALGHSHLTARLFALGLVVLAPSFTFATFHYGAAGGAAAFGFTNVIVLIASLTVSLRLLQAAPSSLFSMVWRSIIATIAMVLTVTASTHLTQTWPVVAILIVAVAIGATTYSLVVYALWCIGGKSAGPESMLIDFVRSARNPRHISASNTP